MGLTLDIALLLSDAALATLCYYMIKRTQRKIDIVQNALALPMDINLLKDVASSPDYELPYVRLEGTVRPVSEVLKSKFDSDITGVVKTNKTYEMKSEKRHGFWYDSNDIIHDAVSIVPFVITNPNAAKAGVHVNISDPLFAELFLDHLRETHNSFEESQSSAMTRGIDRLFGNVTKGYKYVETMLPMGTPILGFGKLAIENEALVLKRPDANQPHIITTLTLNDVLKMIDRESLIYRVLLGMLTCIGVGLLAVTFQHVYKLIKDYMVKRQAQRFYDQLREDNQTENVETLCVICLSNNREVVLLYCGHICLCHECYDLLPLPPICPVCRGPVERMVPVYVS